MQRVRDSEVQICSMWLKINSHRIDANKKPKNLKSSYKLKYLVEDSTQTYVSNESFIKAALSLGVPHKQPTRNSPNIEFYFKD